MDDKLIIERIERIEKNVAKNNKGIDGILNIQSKHLGNYGESLGVTKEIIKSLDAISKLTYINLFVLSLIILLMLKEHIINLLSNTFSIFASIPEKYEILIFTFIITIVGGVISFIVGSLLLEKIKTNDNNKT